jgi:hypothetical protein
LQEGGGVVKLNCKPGDKARLIQCNPGCEALLGSIVRVKETWEYKGNACWWIKTPIHFRLPHHVLQDGVVHEAGRVVWMAAFPDAWLQPLPADDDSRETTLVWPKECRA